MTAEEAMRQIDQLLEDYIQSKISEIRCLNRIARVVGQYEASKP